MAKKTSKGDVQWFLPNKYKRPIAHSALIHKYYVQMMAMEYKTIQDIYDNSDLDPEVKEILAIYIDKGFGESIAIDVFGGYFD